MGGLQRLLVLLAMLACSAAEAIPTMTHQLDDGSVDYLLFDPPLEAAGDKDEPLAALPGLANVYGVSQESLEHWVVVSKDVIDDLTMGLTVRQKVAGEALLGPPIRVVVKEGQGISQIVGRPRELEAISAIADVMPKPGLDFEKVADRVAEEEGMAVAVVDEAAGPQLEGTTDDLSVTTDLVLMFDGDAFEWVYALEGFRNSYVFAATGELRSARPRASNTNNLARIKRRLCTPASVKKGPGGCDHSTSQPTSLEGVGADLVSIYPIPIGTCKWKARYDFQFGQVNNVTGGETTYLARCDQIPTFPSTNNADSDEYTQTNIIHWMKRAYTFFDSYHAGVSLNGGPSSFPVSINTDDLNPKYLWAPYTNIRFPASQGSPDLVTMLHELAHGFNDRFTDFANGSCNVSRGYEAPSYQEAWAEAYSLLLVGELNPGSSYLTDFIWFDDEVHQNSSDISLYNANADDATCEFSPSHREFFIQAVMEAVWDVDCSDTNVNCFSAGSISGADSFGWSSTYIARRRMSDALVHAADVLDTAGGYWALCLNIYLYLRDIGYGSQAAKWKEVVNHHGLNI